MSDHRSLLLAFECLIKPICLLFPFNGLYLWTALPRLLLLNTPTYDQIWAHRFFTLLSFLSLTDRQFSTIAIPKAENAKELKLYLQNPSPFFARPTLLLRVITPTGFSVTIRALVDSGCSRTSIFSELTTLLISKGAFVKYIWPIKVNLFKGYEHAFRTLGGVTLQSVEDESVFVYTTSVLIKENDLYHVEDTPVDLVTSKMASLGIAMFEKPLQNTMWSKEDPNSQYRVDMIIGQDLLNSSILIHPYQPTYHITPSLAIVRTKMGLTFLGKSSVKRFSEWTLNLVEAQQMKETLYPDDTLLNKETISPLTKVQLDKTLQRNLSNYGIKLNHLEYFYFVLSLVLYLHFLFIFTFAILFAFLLKLLIIISFGRHHLYMNTAYTAYLRYLINFVLGMRYLFSVNIVHFLLLFFGFTIGSNIMSFDISPRLVLTVKNGSLTKTVNAYIDSGSNYSYISPKLVKELQIIPKTFKSVKNTVTNRASIQVSEPGCSKNITKIIVICDKFPDLTLFNCLHRYYAYYISYWLKIPFIHESPKDKEYHLLIGTDLIASLLMPKIHSPKCYSVAPNLCAIETRLGYYLQGYQQNNFALIRNWIYYSTYPFNYWKCLTFCLFFDFFMIYFTQ